MSHNLVLVNRLLLLSLDLDSDSDPYTVYTV